MSYRDKTTKEEKTKSSETRETNMTKAKTSFPKIQIIATAILAVAVYCFWYFLFPHIVVGREQSQLFLWNGEYLTERLAVPGGLAQYLGEFLIQFFITPSYGALVYALLFIMGQWLSWQLLERWFPGKRTRWTYLASLIVPLSLCALGLCQYIPLTLTVSILLTMAIMTCLPRSKSHRLAVMLILLPICYWLLGPAVILMLLCCPLWAMGVGVLLLALCILGSRWFTPYPLRQIARGIDYYWEKKSLGSYEDMRYDMLTRLKKWDTIANRYQRHPSPSPAIQTTAAMSYYQLGRIREQELYRSIDTSNQAYQNQSSAFTMSDVYMHLGMVGMSQRAAFEAMEAVPNYNKSGRALRRLVETNLITGESDVAMKYINILKETLFYRRWAEAMRPLAQHPEQVEKHPSLGKLRQIYQQTQDSFFY